MKKLVILMLVLLVSGYASAALSALTSGGSPVVDGSAIDVTATVDGRMQATGVSYVYEFYIDSGPGTFDVSGVVFNPTAFMFGNGWTGTPGETFIRASGGTMTGFEVAEGTSVFTGLAFTDACVVQVYDKTTATTIDLGTFTVPEPMTIALLGLGGLFIRRKK